MFDYAQNWFFFGVNALMFGPRVCSTVRVRKYLQHGCSKFFLAYIVDTRFEGRSLSRVCVLFGILWCVSKGFDGSGYWEAGGVLNWSSSRCSSNSQDTLSSSTSWDARVVHATFMNCLTRGLSCREVLHGGLPFCSWRKRTRPIGCASIIGSWIS